MKDYYYFFKILQARKLHNSRNEKKSWGSWKGNTFFAAEVIHAENNGVSN